MLSNYMRMIPGGHPHGVGYAGASIVPESDLDPGGFTNTNHDVRNTEPLP